MRCEVHCPGGAGGLVAVAAVAAGAGVAVAELAVAYALVLAAGLAVVAAVAFGLQQVLLARTVLVAPWRKQAPVVLSLPAAQPARALSAPRAIEARHVIPGVAVHEEEVHVDRA
jgi:hypothetical protein